MDLFDRSEAHDDVGSHVVFNVQLCGPKGTAVPFNGEELVRVMVRFKGGVDWFELGDPEMVGKWERYVRAAVDFHKRGRRGQVFVVPD